MEFDALFDAAYPPLLRYCHRLTGDPDQAEDLAQEAFFRLLDRGVEGHPEGLRAWLFRVATNLARDRSRTRETRRRILSAVPPPDPVPSPEGELDRAEEIARVRKALEALSPRDREMLLLRQEGFRYKEIAEVVGVSHRSVGTILARALRRFAAELAGEGFQDSAGAGTSKDPGDAPPLEERPEMTDSSAPTSANEPPAPGDEPPTTGERRDDPSD